MRILSTWEQGGLGSNVCLLLSPPDWQALRAVHPHLSRRIDDVEIRALFASRLEGRVSATAGLARGPLPEEWDVDSVAPLLAVASTVDAISEVIQDVVTYPRLAVSDLAPLHQVLGRLHNLVLKDRQLVPRERSGQRSSLARRLLRSFSTLSGLVHRLVALLVAFPAGSMPEAVFVTACEVLASLIHNAKESKRIFVACGGLASLLENLHFHAENTVIQATGLAVLLALSARSVACIRLMVDAGAHEIVAASLVAFPGDDKIVARATGLLANMSNVPCVCPVLHRCGVLELALRLRERREAETHSALEEGQSATSSPFVQDFVQYLVQNLQAHDEP